MKIKYILSYTIFWGIYRAKTHYEHFSNYEDVEKRKNNLLNSPNIYEVYLFELVERYNKGVD